MIEGGIFMWVILTVWLFAIALSFYKFTSLRAYDVDGEKLFDKIRSYLLENKVDEALSLCSNTESILGKIFQAGLRRANGSRAHIEDALSVSIMELTPKLAYHMTYISLAANLSTLFGLLGTIQGLIISFSGVASADPSQKSKVLATGIATAMNTTALGLICAISLMIIFSVLQSKIVKMNDQIDEGAAKLVDLLSFKKEPNA